VIPLLVDLETEWRGGQSQMLLLLQGLYERGHAAELIAAEDSVLAQRAHAAGIYVHLASHGRLRFPAASKIRETMKSGRIELVHANEGHALTAAWLAGAHRRIPVLASRRIGFPLRKNWISTARYNALGKFIANSRYVAQTLIDSGFGVERIAIVNEGVEIPNAIGTRERQLARKNWGVAHDEFLFGCASAFVPEKGQQHLVGAMPAVRQQLPNAKLLLAGEGKNRATVQELAASLGVQDAVLFPGFVTNMQEFYTALDAFVFPSEFEGLGTALQAAMAYALPAISTTRGALGEVVEDERTALVAEPNAESFAISMIRLAKNKALQQKLGDAAREEISNRFSKDLMVDNTLAVYEEMLGTGPGAP
jgi:glycosyltransferase involved in cell wall biosynthesis